MESLEMSMVGFPLQVWKDILFLWEKVNLCAAFSKTKKTPNPQNLYTTFFSLSTCLLKKEVAIFTGMGRFYTPLSQYITSHVSISSWWTAGVLQCSSNQYFSNFYCSQEHFENEPVHV